MAKSHLWATRPSNRSTKQKMPLFSAIAGWGGGVGRGVVCGRGVSAPPPSLWSPHRGCPGLRWRCPPPALCVVSPENRCWRQSRYKRWQRLGRGPADHIIEAHAEKMRDKDQKPRQLSPVSKVPPTCHSRPSSPGRVRVPLDSKTQANGDADRKGRTESVRLGGANYCV